MRLWRGIKALGCAALRDGAYLIPHAAEREATLAELAEQVNKDGGQAWVVEIKPRCAEDEAAFIALFDRSAEYAELSVRLREARGGVAALAPADIARTVKRLRKELEDLQRIDFFPGDASIGAEAAWWELDDAANTVLSPDEPQRVEREIPRLNIEDYQGRSWATRRNLWVDRVASAWLIRRFIDREAKFIWLANPRQCPRQALGFDFDGASFTHVGEKVTFEVLLQSFGLEGDSGLARIGALVRVLDTGGSSTPEAESFEAILAGAQASLNDDDALLAGIGFVLDSLYTQYLSEAKK